MRHLCFLLLLIIVPNLCYGQEIENDISVKSYAIPDSVSKNFLNYSVSDSFSQKSKVPFLNESPKHILFYDSVMNSGSLNHDRIQMPYGTAAIPLWRNAQFIATGDIRDFPGLMQIHSGTIGINQKIGNFSLYAGAVANKYGYFNGLTTQYGVTGNIRYSFSSNLSFTAFGTYYFGRPNGFPMIPVMVGNYGVSTFGGYMSYQFNNTFGMNVGAQTVRMFGSNKYIVEPIVTPTVKLGKVKVGLPVGQILHGIIRSQAEQRNKH